MKVLIVGGQGGGKAAELAKYLTEAIKNQIHYAEVKVEVADRVKLMDIDAGHLHYSYDMGCAEIKIPSFECADFYTPQFVAYKIFTDSEGVTRTQGVTAEEMLAERMATNLNRLEKALSMQNVIEEASKEVYAKIGTENKRGKHKKGPHIPTGGGFYQQFNKRKKR
jgi:hypothetical protein